MISAPGAELSGHHIHGWITNKIVAEIRATPSWPTLASTYATKACGITYVQVVNARGSPTVSRAVLDRLLERGFSMRSSTLT